MWALVANGVVWFWESRLGQMVLNYLWDKVVVELTHKFQQYRDKQRLIEQARNSVEPLKKANTPDEIDSATDSALDDV